jgi:uncharacterized membrane protein
MAPSADRGADASAGRIRYERDSAEFARVANLSDAVFAIAMTLLVLTLDVPDVAADRLAAALVDQVPQFVVFALAFALAANLWWQHHKLFALLGALEPGTIGINLALLAAVALVPFPASLLGSAPTARAAVLVFIGVFVLLNVLHLALVLRVRQVGAWRQPVTQRFFYWLVFTWVSGIAVLLLAAAVTMWQPLGGLAVVIVTMVLGPVAARRAYTRWPEGGA